MLSQIKGMFNGDHARKKILVDYLNNSEDDENKLFLEDFISDEDDL